MPVKSVARFQRGKEAGRQERIRPVISLGRDIKRRTPHTIPNTTEAITKSGNRCDGQAAGQVHHSRVMHGGDTR